MDRVDRHDVGVLQLGERPRFAEEMWGRSSRRRGGRPARPGGPGRRGRRRPAQLGEQAKAEEARSPTCGHRRHGPGQPLGDGGVRAVQLVEDLGVLRDSPRSLSQDGLPAVPSGPARPRSHPQIGQGRLGQRRRVGRSSSGSPSICCRRDPRDLGSARPRCEAAGQVGHVHAEPTLVIGRRDVLARLATQAIFLERDRTRGSPDRGRARGTTPILLQGPG